MASKISFTNAQLLGFTRTPKGGTATFSSGYTKDVREALGWPEIPDKLTDGGLDDELAASVLVLTPSDKALARHAVELDVRAIHSFKTVRLELEGKKGKGHRTELRFKADFADNTGARKLEAYMLTAGKSTVRVTYEKQAVQEELPGTGDAQATLEQAAATSEAED